MYNLRLSFEPCQLIKSQVIAETKLYRNRVCGINRQKHSINTKVQMAAVQFGAETFKSKCYKVSQLHFFLSGVILIWIF